MRRHAIPARLLRIFCVLALGSAATAAEVGQVTVVIKAAVVDIDVSVKPVPKHRFQLAPETAGASEAVIITTSFTGEAQASLLPGRYRIRSVAPVQFGSRALTWDVGFDLGQRSHHVVLPHQVEGA